MVDLGKREKPFAGSVLSLCTNLSRHSLGRRRNPITLFPCHGAAQRAKTENLLLAFIFLQCKKINALKFGKIKRYSMFFYFFYHIAAAQKCEQRSRFARASTRECTTVLDRNGRPAARREICRNFVRLHSRFAAGPRPGTTRWVGSFFILFSLPRNLSRLRCG